MAMSDHNNLWKSLPELPQSPGWYMVWGKDERNGLRYFDPKGGGAFYLWNPEERQQPVESDDFTLWVPMFNAQFKAPIEPCPFRFFDSGFNEIPVHLWQWRLIDGSGELRVCFSTSRDYVLFAIVERCVENASINFSPGPDSRVAAGEYFTMFLQEDQIAFFGDLL